MVKKIIIGSVITFICCVSFVFSLNSFVLLPTSGGTVYYNTTNNITNNITNNYTSNNITGVGVSSYMPYWFNSTHLINSVLFVNNSYLSFVPTGNLPPAINTFNIYGSQGQNKNTTAETQAPITLYIYGGAGGNITRYSASSNTAGTGGEIYLISGLGGSNKAISTQTGTIRGGQAGNLYFYGNTGGDVINNVSTSYGGTGGGILFQSGNGNSPTSGISRRGGDAGGLTFTGGSGGSGLGNDTINSRVKGGDGASISFSTGSAGSNTKCKGTTQCGAGGTFGLYAGSGSSVVSGVGNNGDGGTGGAIQLTAGPGGTANDGISGAGGLVWLMSGTGGSAINGTNGTGGNMRLFAGGGGGASGNGGNVYISGGQGTTRGAQGNIYLGYTDYLSLSTGNISIGSSVAPASLVHQNAGNALATYHKFTAGTTTGTTTTDGFDLGITTTGKAEIRQYENLNISVLTNNIEALRVSNKGYLTLLPVTYNACDASTEGSIYYNTTTKIFYGCNSTAWVSLY